MDRHVMTSVWVRGLESGVLLGHLGREPGALLGCLGLESGILEEPGTPEELEQQLEPCED